MLPLILLFLAPWPRWRIIKETIFSSMNLIGYWLGAGTVLNIMSETTFVYSYTNSNVTRSVISNSSRGNIRSAWELLYAHYQDLKGLNALKTVLMRDLVNPNSGGAEGGVVRRRGASINWATVP